jgi:hypothetical protein
MSTLHVVPQSEGIDDVGISDNGQFVMLLG